MFSFSNIFCSKLLSPVPNVPRRIRLISENCAKTPTHPGCCVNLGVPAGLPGFVDSNVNATATQPECRGSVYVASVFLVRSRSFFSSSDPLVSSATYSATRGHEGGSMFWLEFTRNIRLVRSRRARATRFRCYVENEEVRETGSPETRKVVRLLSRGTPRESFLPIPRFRRVRPTLSRLTSRRNGRDTIIPSFTSPFYRIYDSASTLLLAVVSTSDSNQGVAIDFREHGSVDQVAIDLVEVRVLLFGGVELLIGFGKSIRCKEIQCLNIVSNFAGLHLEYGFITWFHLCEMDPPPRSI